MQPRTRKTLIGCGVGCAAVVLLLLGACISFTVWLRAPGDLLEPDQLLDPEAIGHVEGRLELDNPGTEALFEAGVELLDSQEPPVDFPLVRMLSRLNQAYQVRRLRRVFPTRVVWNLYPSETPGESEHLVSVSIQRASHQFLLFDWLLGFFLGGKNSPVPTIRHRGERIYVLTDDSTASDETVREELEGAGAEGPSDTAPKPEPTTAYVFLRGEGFFFASDERVARRAIDLLEGQPLASGAGPLDRLFASAPERGQLRGALINQNAQLAAFSRFVLPGDQRDEELERALAGVERATGGGGFLESGDLELELDLDSGPELRAPLQRALDRSLEELATDLPLEWSVEERPGGVRARLVLRDVPRVVREAVDELQAEARSQMRSGAGASGTVEIETGPEGRP